MNDTRVSRRKILRSAVFVACSLVVIIIALLLLRVWEKQQGGLPWQDYDETYEQTITYNGKSYVFRDGIETVLVIGLDKFEGTTSQDSYNNDKQADFLSLVILDKDNDTATTLQINRDTIAQMNILGINGETVDTKKGQLALSHTYGSGGKDSCRNTVDAVSNFLYQTPIDHYVSITMDAVSQLNDMVGGVRLTVLEDFSAIDSSLVKGQEITLNGKQALTYVRARGSVADESNINRMQRQQQYMQALYEKVLKKSETDKEFISKAGLKLAEYMVSDCTVAQLERIAGFVAKYDVGEIQTIKGESKVGQEFMEFHPDEEALQKQIVELFYEPL